VTRFPRFPRYRPCWLPTFTCLVALTLSPVASAAASTIAPGRDSTIAFTQVSVIPMDSDRVLGGQTVIVTDGRIVAIGPSSTVSVPRGAQQIDGRGKFLIPGLADMHVHLGFTDTTSAIQSLMIFARAGVTSVRNMDYIPWGKHYVPGFVLQLRARTASRQLIGPRIYTSGQWDIGDTTPAFHSPFVDTTIPNYVLDHMRRYKAAGYDFVKIHDETLPTYRLVVAAAKQVGLPFEGHVPPGVPLQEALEAHQVSIEHLTGYPYADTTKFAALVAATKAAGTWICPTLVSRPKKSVLAMSRLVNALQRGGVGLLSGTDFGGWFDVLKGMASLPRELQYLVWAGLTPYQALVTSTRNPALFFGTFQETGTIAVGKRADLVLLNANPLDDIANVMKVDGVVLYGRWFTAADLTDRITTARKNRTDKPASPLGF
jgi:imidazolonepropionase-like amidohydrolase